jgi:hypothetical protein
MLAARPYRRFPLEKWAIARLAASILVERTNGYVTSLASYSELQALLAAQFFRLHEHQSRAAERELRAQTKCSTQVAFPFARDWRLRASELVR